MVGSNGPFVMLPEQPILQDGKLKRDVHGKPAYFPTVQWKDRATAGDASVAMAAIIVEVATAKVTPVKQPSWPNL